MPGPHSLAYYNFVVSFKPGGRSASTFFFSKIVLPIPGLLHFYLNLRISFSVSAKKHSWDFDRYCVETIDEFEEYCHLHTTSSNL